MHKALLIAAGLLMLGAGAAKMTAGTTRGVRNNNPGNIRFDSRNNWQGQVGKDDAGFVIFDSPVNGLRAAAKLLRNKMNKGQNTISALVSSWAPATENDTPAYIAAVARSLGVSANARLNTTHLQGLLAAIVKHENAGYQYPVAMVQAAVQSIG